MRELLFLILLEVAVILSFVITIATLQRKGNKSDFVLLFKNYYQKKDKVLPRTGIVRETFMLEFWRTVFLGTLWLFLGILIYSDLIASAGVILGLIASGLIGWLYSRNQKYTGTLFYEVLVTVMYGFNMSVIVDPNVREWVSSFISFDTSYLPQPLVIGIWVFSVSFVPGFLTTCIRYTVWKNAMTRRRRKKSS